MGNSRRMMHAGLAALLSPFLTATFVRFLGVGVINTAFGYVAFLAVIALGAPTFMAVATAGAAGILFNFFTVGGLVFRDKAAHRLIPFIAAYLVIIGINTGALRLLELWPLKPALAQLILTPFLAPLSYILNHAFVFRGAAR